MKERKTAKAVSLGQLNNWIKENIHLTWHFGSEAYGEGAFGSKHPDHSPTIKYIFPSLDTRTMTIYHICVEGFQKFVVNHCEEFDGNLLELLSQKIKNNESVGKDVDDWEYVRNIQQERFDKEFKDGIA